MKKMKFLFVPTCVHTCILYYVVCTPLLCCCSFSACTPRTSSVLRLHVYDHCYLLGTNSTCTPVYHLNVHLYRHHSIDAINALYFGSFLKCAVSLFPFLFDLPFRLGAKRFLFFRPPAPLAFFFLLDSTAPVDPNATSNTFSSFTSPNSRHF